MDDREHWPRWMRASCARHFDIRKGGYTMFIEGEERDTDEEQEFFEFRFDGPWISQVSRDYYKCDVEINIAVTTVMNDDLYRHQRIQGHLQKVFELNIDVFRYGDGAQDDNESLLGCLRLKQDGRETVRVSNFGQVRPDTRIEQSTLEGHYWVDLKI